MKYLSTMKYFLISAITVSAFSPTRMFNSLPKVYKMGKIDKQMNLFSTDKEVQNDAKDVNKLMISTIAVATSILSSPLVVFAEEVSDDYEYGAVNAPIGIAWGVGVLAILTATLPVFLRGGEEAFEEMKENSSDSFGKNKDVLTKRKRTKM